MNERDHDPDKRANLPPGFDEKNPYENEDVTSYPEWWRQNIEEFRNYTLRPYRPPRFSDGVIVPPILRELEKEVGDEIRLRNTQPEKDRQWQILIGKRLIGEVPQFRHSEGYSVYEIDSEDFVELVRKSYC